MSRHLSIVIATLLVAPGCSRPEPADVVFLNGRIYTLAGALPTRVEDEPFVEAIAVRDHRVMALGTTSEMKRRVGRETQVHDLAGQTAFPGFVDCHVHLQSLGRSLREIDLVGTHSFAEVIERVRARAATTPAATWLTGRGWDQNDWQDANFPDHAALSAVTPDHPVYLRRVDGHAALVNALALAQCGVDARTPDPAGGHIDRRPDGSPAGVLVDAATGLVSNSIPKPTADERRSRLRAALAHCAAAGLTGVHDAGETRDEANDARALLAANELPIRVYAMWDATPDTEDPGALEAALHDGPQLFDPSMHLAFRTVKLMVDGALGSRGAALLEPYTDKPQTRGLPQYTPEALRSLVARIHAAGFQVATHAIGDAGNRMVLDAYESVQRAAPRADPRHRIEHAQILSAADIGRFAALGVLPSMQPTHCTSDMPWAGTRLGTERLKGAYVWRSLRDTGVIIPAGSDAPVESVSPLLGIYAAVTRQTPAGEPAAGWSPGERLSRSEAVRGFTSWAAFASFTEKDLGTIEVGKLADLVVLDRDLLRVPAAQIPGAVVLDTVVGGVIVHPASAQTPPR